MVDPKAVMAPEVAELVERVLDIVNPPLSLAIVGGLPALVANGEPVSAMELMASLEDIQEVVHAFIASRPLAVPSTKTR